MLKGMFGLRMGEEAGENCVMRNAIICAFYQILLG
jgi:hypothetical protein